MLVTALRAVVGRGLGGVDGAQRRAQALCGVPDEHRGGTKGEQRLILCGCDHGRLSRLCKSICRRSQLAALTLFSIRLVAGKELCMTRCSIVQYPAECQSRRMDQKGTRHRPPREFTAIVS